MQECRTVYYVGPRKVSVVGRGEPIVYLGKDLASLIGKKVMLEVRVINV